MTTETINIAPSFAARPISRVLLILGMTPPVLAMIVHATVKDSVLGLAMLHYAFPPKVLAIAGIILAGLAWMIKWKKAFLVNTAYAVVCILIVACRRNAMLDHPQHPTGTGISVTFWNISRGRMGFAPIFKTVAEHSADLIGFVEFGNPDPEELTMLTELFPHHHLHRLPGGMAMLSKDSPTAADYIGAADSYRINHLTFKTFEVAIVDINSGMFNDRHNALSTLTDLVEGKTGLIIMGDFNTPHRTVASTRLGEVAISGAATELSAGRDSWPYPVPCLAIDQIWATREWIFSGYSKHGSTLSDHCLMKAVLFRKKGSEQQARP